MQQIKFGVRRVRAFSGSPYRRDNLYWKVPGQVPRVVQRSPDQPNASTCGMAFRSTAEALRSFFREPLSGRVTCLTGCRNSNSPSPFWAPPAGSAHASRPGALFSKDGLQVDDRQLLRSDPSSSNLITMASFCAHPPTYSQYRRTDTGEP